MLNTLKQNAVNIPGFRTKRKIVIFESDDWGAQRMSSMDAYKELIKKGIRADRSRYDTLDSLECKSDIEALFDILNSHKNAKGQHPKFTCNFVMGNPDFEAIRANKFQNFVNEHFFDSYRKYYAESLENVWEAAIGVGLVVPQFHAREHLNVSLWMEDLQAGNENTLNAFDHNFFGLKTKTGSNLQKHYLAAYFAESPSQLEIIKGIVEDGLSQFEETFGLHSQSFIGCNYVWPKSLEQHLQNNGVKILQGQRGQLDPLFNGQGPRVRYHYSGQKNEHKQIYLVRNVLFEPYDDTITDWVDHSIRAIQNSFFWNKPAIISSHRINYVSNMDLRHRDASLRKLDTLLKRIVQQWPEVEFMSSNELGNIIFS